MDLFHFDTPPLPLPTDPAETVTYYRERIEYDPSCDLVYEEFMDAYVELMESRYDPETLVIGADKFKKLLAYEHRQLNNMMLISPHSVLEQMLGSYRNLKVVMVQGDILQVLPSNNKTLHMAYIQTQRKS